MNLAYDDETFTKFLIVFVSAGVPRAQAYRMTRSLLRRLFA